jgi:hypothetical protein
MASIVVSLRTHAIRDRVINAGHGGDRGGVTEGRAGTANARCERMVEPAREFERLWRVRRRHAHIDALLRARGGAWDLRFTRNDRVLMTQEFADRAAAYAAAETRLRELQRAGWNTHW